MREFVAGLPKVELHVHHVGSASPVTVAELAARHESDSPVPADPQELAEYFAFTDFEHFLRVYLSVVNLIRDAEDVRALTWGVARDLAGQNVRYAELTVTPWSSVRQGIPAEAFCEAIEDARLAAARELNLSLAWCFDIPGEATLNSGEKTLDIALRQRPAGLVSFGIGGAEVARSPYRDIFAAARAAGLHIAPHAGETTSAAEVWDAIRLLRAERIGHGIRAVEDPSLVAFLAENRIPLEISPTSNLCTRAVPSIADHPLAELVAAGVPVSINSDDPSMFSTTLIDEYVLAGQMLDLDKAGLADLARAAVRQSFAGDWEKSIILREIDEYCTSLDAGFISG